MAPSLREGEEEHVIVYMCHGIVLEEKSIDYLEHVRPALFPHTEMLKASVRFSCGKGSAWDTGT